MMKKFALFTTFSFALALPMLSGCTGSGEPTVVEAPTEAATEEQPAMDGMSDDEYNAAMEADMNQ